jgi:hypothetical protein
MLLAAALGAIAVIAFAREDGRGEPIVIPIDIEYGLIP